MSRRQKFYDYYRRNYVSATGYGELTANSLDESVRASAASDKYKFKGTAIANSIVVRADLNGYSKWAASKPIEARAALLSDFFTKVVSELDLHDGIYFRDEGDCVVAIFSGYFSNKFSYTQAEPFCRAVVRGTYGADKLTAKCCVAIGQIAVYQKAHEVGTDDWSAEGQPFVNAARLEHSVPSKAAVYYLEDEFAPTILPELRFVGDGVRYYWSHGTEQMRVPGLSLAGGWADVRVVEHVPGGRV